METNSETAPQTQSLRYWADLYLEDFAYEHAHTTAITYRAWMNHFFNWMDDEQGVEEPTLADFTSDVLDEYVRYQRKRAPERRSVVHDPKKPPKTIHRNTVRSAMHPIKGLAKYLVFKKRLTEDPTESVSIPAKDTKGTRPVGTDDELFRMIGEAEKNPNTEERALELAILYMVANSGARVAEVCNMPLSTLNLQEGKITVLAKGGELKTYYFSPRTGDAVAAWLNFRPKKCQHDFVFCHGTKRKVGDEYIRKLIRKYAAAAGIEDARGILPHSQKHLIGCRLMNEGIDIVTIASRLAHSKPTTTLQHYLHASDARVQASRNIELKDLTPETKPEPPTQQPQPRPKKRQRPVPKPQVPKSVAQRLLDNLIKLPSDPQKRRSVRGK